MASYPPPIPLPVNPIFNEEDFTRGEIPLTASEANKKYLKKTGDTATGLIIFNAGEKTNEITFSGDNTVQTTAFKDLSPSPAGSYTSPSSVVVNTKGQITSITGGSAVNANVYNYPQIWRCSTLYALGSSVPLPGGLKTAVINIPLPTSGGLTETPQAMCLTLEIHYVLMEQTAYGSVASRIMGQWYSVVSINVSPFSPSTITFVKLVDTTSTGTSAWSSQSITYASQPPVGGGYSTGTFTPLSYTYANGASPHPTLTITFGGITSPYLSASSAGGATNYQPLLGLRRTVRIIDTPVQNTYVNSNTQTFPNTNTSTFQSYFSPVSSS